jgi:hypothetical protein
LIKLSLNKTRVDCTKIRVYLLEWNVGVITVAIQFTC